jgi:lysophospholipase L1-like esterase
MIKPAHLALTSKNLLWPTARLGRGAVLSFAFLALLACSDDQTPSDAPPGSSPAGMSGVGGGVASAGTAGGGSGGAAGSGGSGSGGALGGAGAPTAGSGGVASGGAAGSSAGGGLGGAGTAGAAGANAAGAGATSAGGAGVAGAGGDGAAGGAAGGAPLAGAGGIAGGGAGSGGAASGGSAGVGGAGYQPCPASGPCKIMPFGDSITEGFPVFGGYRMELFRLARADGHEITFVGSLVNGPNMVDGVTFPRNHEGHGAHTISGSMGIAQFVDSSMSSYTPDIVMLMIGTNDINGNISVASAPTRLGALLDDIYDADPNVLIILAQIVPTRSDGTNQAVQTYNAAMPALVSQRTSAGRHLVLVDMYEAFTRDADYKTALFGDNLHPNEAGYARMGATWYAVLSPYLR